LIATYVLNLSNQKKLLWVHATCLGLCFIWELNSLLWALLPSVPH
jgi:hypothetical protein